MNTSFRRPLPKQSHGTPTCKVNGYQTQGPTQVFSDDARDGGRGRWHTSPSREAWCHMDLVMLVAACIGRPFWTPGLSPLQSRDWLGHYRTSEVNHPLDGTGAAYNGKVHFTIVNPNILPTHLLVAHTVLEMALNGDYLQSGWRCCEGTTPGDPGGRRVDDLPLHTVHQLVP